MIRGGLRVAAGSHTGGSAEVGITGGGGVVTLLPPPLLFTIHMMGKIHIWFNWEDSLFIQCRIHCSSKAIGKIHFSSLLGRFTMHLIGRCVTIH